MLINRVSPCFSFTLIRPALSIALKNFCAFFQLECLTSTVDPTGLDGNTYDEYKVEIGMGSREDAESGEIRVTNAVIKALRSWSSTSTF